MKVSRSGYIYFRPREFFSRNSPVTIVLYFAIFAIILGLIFSVLSFLVWIGFLFGLIYIIYFIIWLFLNKWW
ncbi:hypothetical protein J4217_03315 [Candidatus Pacearchaeota archaeon]|nr:hypothetical protein [Candidatus Pacearchaeota archaeon]